MKKEFTAKTLDEAKAMAAAEFGVAAEEIDFDILEQPRKGLFGMKGVARVMASYEAPEAPVASETAAVSEVSEAAEHSEPAEETHAEEPAPASFEDEGEKDIPELPEDFDIEGSAKVQAAKKYLTDVLHALGLENFQINAVRRDGNVVLDITGDKLGVVIGRRGETLDSLQYLTILLPHLHRLQRLPRQAPRNSGVPCKANFREGHQAGQKDRSRADEPLRAPHNP